MEDRLQQIRQRSSQVLERLSPGQRVALMMLAIIIIGTLTTLVVISARPDYATLYSGVDERFGGDVVSRLSAQKVPYELEAGGVIRVPRDRVAELRMTLAADGVIPGGGVGYELIDKDDMFGQSDQIIQVHKQRMLQGELSRSISALAGVRQARVHLAIPKPSLFTEDKRPPSASVVLELMGGSRLSKQQIRSVVDIVAGAVSGLEPERVNVVDNRGRVLNRFSEGLIGGQTALEYQKSMEQKLKFQAESVLSRFLGVDNFTVEVNSEMDFSREERTEELFNPEKQVARSEETLSEERENGGNRVGGGAGDNTAQGVVRVGDASSSSRERVATNYEIDKVTKHVHGPMATLKRLSIAVVINSNYRGVAKGEDGNAAPEQVSQEQLDRYKKLVQNAVGFSKDRGDSVTLTSEPFQEASVDTLKALDDQRTDQLIDKSLRFGLIFLIAAFVFFIAYKLVKYLTSDAEAAEILQDGQLPPGEDQLALPGAELLDELDEDEGPLIEKIREYVKRNPDKASAVVRYWLSPIDEE